MMLRIVAAMALVLVALPAQAGEPAETPTISVGKEITEKKILPISQLLDHAEDYVGEVVRVEGEVLEVCPKMGCWMNLASDREGEHIRIKVHDGDLVFPMEAIGGTSLVEGELMRIEMDLDQTRRFLAHEAEEKGEVFDPDSVTEPLAYYQIWGHGARMALAALPAEAEAEPESH